MEVIKSSEINLLCRLFHGYLLANEYDLIKKDIFNKYELEFLIDTKNRGLISLILQYGINTSNNEIISLIEPHLSMKRDYLNLIVYYMKDTKCSALPNERCIKIFKNICLETFLQKDLEFLIENELYFLLPHLEGMFIKLDIEGSDIYNSKLKKYQLQNTDKYITHFSKKISHKALKEFNNVICNNYDYIIDAGNILFSRTGLIGNHSIRDLQTVVDAFPNSLIIIHKRHLENKHILDIIKNMLYYATPQYMNDDLFTILAFLNRQVNIITNDAFKDHSIDDNHLRFHINDILIKYTNDKGVFVFEPIRKYTQCVQLLNGCVYIPSKKGKECKSVSGSLTTVEDQKGSYQTGFIEIAFQ